MQQTTLRLLGTLLTLATAAAVAVVIVYATDPSIFVTSDSRTSILATISDEAASDDAGSTPSEQSQPTPAEAAEPQSLDEPQQASMDQEQIALVGQEELNEEVAEVEEDALSANESESEEKQPSEVAVNDQSDSADGQDSQNENSEDCAITTVTKLPFSTEGELRDRECLQADGRNVDLYRIRLSTTMSVDISLQSDQFDAQLHVLGDRGEFYAENDDSDECCDARLIITLPSDDYNILVTSYGPLEHGRYRFSISELEDQARQSDAPTEPATASDQFAGDHGGPTNLNVGRTMPQLAARLTDREREVRLGPWFYRHLFQFSDEKVSHDANLGLIGYNYYNSNWPSSVCRNSEGDPFSYGWDSQPYEATPDGRRGVSDWRTRSWHSVYSVIHGTVVYVDEQLGEIAIFDGRNTIYYKHLNEIDWRIIPDELTGEDGVASVGVEVFPGDYLGRMGMRGTAIAPHLTLEVRAGLPPHDLCPPEGTSTSPLPYLYRLLGGR